MKRAAPCSGFTLAEAMVAMAGTVIIVTALLLGAVGVQRSMRASEIYATNQADQRRLLDYLARDIRRAVGIASTTTVSGMEVARLGKDGLVIEGSTALALTLPGYYRSNEPANENYDDSLPVSLAGDRVDYGTKQAVAPGVPVMFRKIHVATEGCVCFVRQEGDAQEVIVRRAENLQLRVTLDPGGRRAALEVTFRSPFSAQAGPLVATFDEVMLRNQRIDLSK
jgi:Tfp pilus assembly protein PilW